MKKIIILLTFIGITLFFPLQAGAADNLCCPDGYYDWACTPPGTIDVENKHTFDGKCCNLNFWERIYSSDWYKDKISCDSQQTQDSSPTPTPTPTPTPKSASTTGAVAISKYSTTSVTVDDEVTVEGYGLARIEKVELWGANFWDQGAELEITEQSDKLLIFKLNDPRHEFNENKTYFRKVTFFYRLSGNDKTIDSSEFSIRPKMFNPNPTPTPTPTPTPDQTGKPEIATKTYAQIHGYHDGGFKLYQYQKEISVGAVVSTYNATGHPCDVADSVDLKFEKIVDWTGKKITPITLDVSHVQFGTSTLDNVYQNCQSYSVALKGNYVGTYRLTATHDRHDTKNFSGDPVIYTKSWDEAIVKIEHLGDTGYAKIIKTTSNWEVSGNNVKGIHTENKVSSKNNSDQKIKIADLFPKNKNVAGVVAVQENGKINVVNDSSSTSNSIQLTPKTGIENANCSSDQIPVISVGINKIKNDGSVETVLNDANYPNCQAYTLDVDLNNDNRIEATVTYQQDPTSNYASSQGSTVIYVNDTQVTAKDSVKMSSSPDVSAISSLDNPTISASTNKVVDNPVFEVTKDGQTSSMEASSSQLGCQDNTGDCVYTLYLTQPNGDYKITFKNGDASDSISFNTAGGSCPYSGDTCSYSTADGLCYSGTGATGFNTGGCQYSCGPIACPSSEKSSNISGVGIIDNGQERELPLNGEFIDLDLSETPQTVYRLVIHHNDNTADTYRTVIFDSNQTSSCSCTYSQACDASGKSGSQTCHGVGEDGGCHWDSSGNCAADCTACVADQTGGEPTPTVSATPACSEGEIVRNECIGCNTSQQICKHADCSEFVCVSSQSDGACSNYSCPVSDPEVDNIYWFCEGNIIKQHNPGMARYTGEWNRTCEGDTPNCVKIHTDGYIDDADCQ